MARRPEEPLAVGRVVGVSGIRGWVKAESYGRTRESILDYRTWWLRLGGDWQPYAVVEGRRQGRRIVASLQGVVDRDAAARLIGADVGVPWADMPALAAGQYYWADLEGLAVVDGRGRTLGEVSHLFETGANDILVVRAGEQEHWIPYVKSVIQAVDLIGRRIIVDWDPDDAH